MGALTIAFDTIIVGALALPWVLLAIHLFFFEGENLLGGVLSWVTQKGLQTAAGVLLFAMTYTLGSAVSRIGQDFFNDDDLYLQVGGRLFRVGVTEDRLRARVYCDMDDNHLLLAGAQNPTLAGKIYTFQTLKTKKALCWLTLRWSVRYTYIPEDDKLNEAAIDIFGLQENALMVKGADFTLRLRQIHDQIMVLRGAAFNGVIGFSLCVFAWGAALRREKRGSWLRRAVAAVPVLYFAVASIATVHHFRGREPLNSPYMEFTLVLLALVGAWLVWKPPSSTKAEEARAKETGTGEKTEPKCDWRSGNWAGLAGLTAILTIAAVLGWWSTEVLYGEQVVYSYASQATAAAQK
ncbi:MAG: hypothetical protein WA830_01990 [Candidatus Sulfotelmatobacter sp.]